MKLTHDENRKRIGIYLLPNLLTTAGLFAGFYAIVVALRGDFNLSAIMLFIAMIMDGLDGRIARLTHTQSAFGAEYDSLSDMVCFGIVPALVIFIWLLHNLGNLGWLISFIYVAAGALRLARFNTQIATADKRYFQGLSITPSAGLVASIVWLGNKYGMSGTFLTIVIALITILIAVLMVSNVRYHSFKQIDWKGRVPFVTVSIIVLAFVLVAINPPLVLFIIFFCYALSGPVLTLWNLRKARSMRKKSQG